MIRGRTDDSAPVPAKGRRRMTARENARRQEILEMPHEELGRLIQTLRRRCTRLPPTCARVRRPPARRGQRPERELGKPVNFQALMSETLIVRGARRAQPQNVSIGVAPRAAGRLPPAVGVGEVVAGLRHDLRRGAAALCRVAVVLRRQFLGQMDKPDVDFIEASRGHLDRPEVGVPTPGPRSGRSPDLRYLRLLFARIGVPTARSAAPDHPPDAAADRRPGAGAAEGTRFQVLAPVVRGRKGSTSRCWPTSASRATPGPGVDGEVVE